MPKISGDRITQIILLILIAVIGFFLVTGLKSSSEPQGAGPGSMPGNMPPGGSENDNAEDTVVAVETEVIALRDILKTMRVNGDVIADTTVDVYSDAKGRLVEKVSGIGDYVVKGAVIARVDPSLPGQVYGTSPVYAAIEGTITADYTAVGDTVSTTSPIVAIGDLSHLLIRSYIPEKYVSVLFNGMEVNVRFDAFPNLEADGFISEISPVMNSTSRTIEVKVSFDDPQNIIKAGMFAKMTLITDARYDAVTVPQTAVFDYLGENCVYRIRDNQAERIHVALGLSSDEYVEITSGLSVGDEIIIQGISHVDEGSSVRSFSSRDENE